jgi:elongation factor 1-alpha
MAKTRKETGQGKPQVNMAFIGHIDHGKSTLVSRILLATGAIDPHLIQQYRKLAEEQGKPGFEFAYVMDDLPEERKRGVTIRAQIKEFDTRKHHFTISDAPGHEDYITNMIKGTSQAEAAVLLVDANDTFNKGIQPQTKEHIILAKTFGIEEMLVAVNKMDVANPPYSEDVYNTVVSNVTELLGEVGYNDEQVRFVPISAYRDDNISAPSRNMEWYSGRPLLSLIDDFEPTKDYNNFPLRWAIREVMKVTRAGYIPVGYVFSGELKVGDDIVFMPGNHHAQVRTLEEHQKKVNIARTGDPVGADLRVIGNWDKSSSTIRSGYVAGHASNPPTVAKNFTARIMVLNHPTEIYTGYAPIIHVHEASVKSIMQQMLVKYDRGMNVVEKDPSSLQNGDIADVVFRPLLPLVVEPVDVVPPLGRFAMRDSNRTVGAGMVLSVEPKEY